MCTQAMGYLQQMCPIQPNSQLQSGLNTAFIHVPQALVAFQNVCSNKLLTTDKGPLKFVRHITSAYTAPAVQSKL